MKKEIIKFYLEYKLYIFPAVVALSSLFLIIFAIYPQTAKLIDGQKSASQLAGKSEFLETKVQALESVDGEDLARKVRFVLNALPAEKDFANVLALLQQLTAESGFSVSSIALGNSGTKMGNSDSFDVRMEIRGSKVFLQGLLSNLENSPRLIRVKVIDISSANQQGADIALSLGVLYSGLPKDFGAADSPLPELTSADEGLIAALEKINTTTPTSFAQSPRGKANPFE
ncbi:type 4a pilus biogenesis protein PilO [Candidatus Daviesbacteria bacterium]|nr:type 4a pilus biogenesis protein PilO [Candidatus Daviesbacteria bacterium]